MIGWYIHGLFTSTTQDPQMVNENAYYDWFYKYSDISAKIQIWIHKYSDKSTNLVCTAQNALHYINSIQVTYPPAGFPPPLLTVIITSISLSSKAYRYIVLSTLWVHVCNSALGEETACIIVREREPMWMTGVVTLSKLWFWLVKTGLIHMITNAD